MRGEVEVAKIVVYNGKAERNNKECEQRGRELLSAQSESGHMLHTAEVALLHQTSAKISDPSR